MRAIITLSLLTLSFYAFPQKVGLVLSGGGAKGLAHIGVIKALEENGIPIDYITGTSIGAIIGGLYAIGYTPEEMIDQFLSDDFYNWSKGIIPVENIYYYKMPDPNSSMFSFSIYLKEGAPKTRLPSYLIPTHYMDIAFMQIYSPGIAAADYNFDNLFVPFRAVATDIYNNRPHIFEDGDLGTAIRASMTYPFYFRPVIVDGVPLFDGGIINNFPWEVMKKEFKPDIIIGSNVSENAPIPEEIDIFSQIENMIVSKTNFNLPDSLGIVLNIEIPNISLLDFSRVNELYHIGYKSTINSIDSIKRFVSRREDFTNTIERRRQFLDKQKDLIFNSISITGLNKNQSEYVRKTFRTKASSVSYNKFKKEYFKLVSDKYIDRIYPTTFFNEDSNLYDLILNISTEPKFNFSLGGNISSSSLNQGYFGADYRHLSKSATYIAANIYFGRLYSSLNLSTRFDFPSNIPYFFQVNGNMSRFDFYSSSTDPFFEDLRPPYLIQKENFLEGLFGFPLKANSMIRFSLKAGYTDNEYYQISNFKKSDYPDHTFFNFVNTSISIENNTLNRYIYPNSGFFNQIKVNFINGREYHNPGTTSQTNVIDYNYLEWINLTFKREHYKSLLKRRIVLGSYFEANISNQPFFNNYTATILSSSSFQPTPHSKTIFIPHFRSHNFAALGLIPIFEFSPEFNLRSEIYTFIPYKIINRLSESFTAEYSEPFKSLYLIYSIGFVYNTPVGPASLMLNYYPKDNTQYYFVFNFGYILFNKRALD